ncbi:helix-turn-helix domain-containing protein [Streptosporangium sp. NPDC051023]|uniref:winged helix-turn-helix transcriptional regulator n=1 Tax=Streptosporangium sp. NPDC051023 TaxID=3155410 RepID=UPI00344F6B3C
MVKRTRFDDSECPVARSMDAIGDWWSLLIVRDAFDGNRRFGEFQRSLGVAKNILAARLRTLVAGGVFDVVPASDGSAYQEYVLTPKGRDLFPVIVALRQWGEVHFFAAGEPHSELVDRLSERSLAPLRVHAADGRAVDPDDTVVVKINRAP